MSDVNEGDDTVKCAFCGYDFYDSATTVINQKICCWACKKKHAPLVDRVPVTNSSNVEFFEYHSEEKTLLIGFKNNKEYSYENFDQKTFDDLLKAQSKGSFVARRIRDKFVCRRVK